MIKNKKGYTLIELLAVMMLLVIILVIAYPSFSSLTSNAVNNNNVSNKIIRQSMLTYIYNNEEDFLSGYDCFPIGKLVAYDYLDLDSINDSNKSYDPKSCIKIVKTDSGYDIVLGDDEEEEKKVEDSVDYTPPYFVKSDSNISEDYCYTNNNIYIYLYDDGNILTKDHCVCKDNTSSIYCSGRDLSDNRAIPYTYKLEQEQTH